MVMGSMKVRDVSIDLTRYICLRREQFLRLGFRKGFLIRDQDGHVIQLEAHLPSFAG